MAARIGTSVFLSLVIFSATAGGQSPDYYQSSDIAADTESLEGGIDVDSDTASPAIESTCAPCAADCDYCEPWRLFPPCDGGCSIYGWLAAGFVGNTSSPDSKFNGPYNAVDRSNELMLNQTYFVAEKKLRCDACAGIGGRVDMLYGEDFFHSSRF